MKLSRVERIILSNQCKILEKLYPDEAAYYAETREALESGYERHYEWRYEHVLADTMSDEECGEVIQILAMFRALHDAYTALTDKSGIDEWQVKFHGFDGNNEAKQMGYAAYYCSTDGGRFTELTGKDFSFNSHMPTLARYRIMRDRWEGLGEPVRPSKEQVIHIVST